ncbi:MAG TPA: hypothetical protein VGP93_02830, partial [Polyangiaceae bacterium]|nr:hypothetical protein [Polyangiaceae bacterium]
MNAGPLSERFIQEIRQEFPAFRLVAKRQDRLSLLIHRTLLVVTLGGQRGYLSHYHTVLGYTLYTPDSWESTPDLDRVIVLRHERVHLRQRRRYGFALMAFLYIIPFFPLGLAYGRARLEWEAYAETLRATAELKGLSAARDRRLRRSLIARFTGPDYGWMWPFPRSL